MPMLREKRRIAFYGGTFDPFHSGHLKMALAAMDWLDLHSIFFVPAARNPLKGEPPVASDSQRVGMIRRGIQGYRRFGLWEGELGRKGPSYTLHSVEHIERIYPNSRLFWIIGSDQLPHLSKWHGIEELVFKVSFILVQRPGFKVVWPGIPGLTIYPVENDPVPVSGTNIRARVRAGSSIDGLVPAEVADFIRSEGLYR